MKKCFVLVVSLVLVTASSLYGFEKGTKSIGGTVSFYGYKNSADDAARNVLSIAPQGSYFLFNNFSIDVHVIFGTAWGGNSSSSTDLGIGLGGRYFYKKFYGGVFFNYSASRYLATEIIGGDMAYKKYNWHARKDLTLRVGRLFDIAKNIYLDLGLFYNIGIGKITNSIDSFVTLDNDRSEFGTLAGVAIFF